MKKLVIALLIIVTATAFSNEKTLAGRWEYLGGIYNGKKDGAPTEYTLQRRYDAAHFNAFALQKGSRPDRYEAGNYILKGDTCIETQTFSSQPTKLKNIAVHYRYQIRHDSLIFNGTLPSGMVVEEYWKRIK
jgi:hypothetical protein